ncbi:helix-turn-helix domain-containing protein [Rhodococcus rhodochrous]|uniref:helix-turn-helix domain-containing protein n=1 Tax=Rhodococcus rhodochrous TaxID=1829 RepID=UPI00128ECBBD|nr:helix-turn-helix transcriptional regulator [Rhodococcus rhodochrous]
MELAEAPALPAAADDICSRLTHRALEIAIAISTGLSSGAIAEHMFISVNTVRFHTGNVLRKLGARNRSEAAAIISRWRLLSPHDSSIGQCALASEESDLEGAPVDGTPDIVP